MPKHFYIFTLASFVLLVLHGTTSFGNSRVTIYRDTYWVPHIFGNTDEDCAFGMGYAQAEDNLPQIIQNVRQATGTLAEIQGKDYLEHDYFINLARIPQVAEENYEKIPPKFRSVIEAYCDGVNYYVQTHPAKTPQGWRPLVPQDIVAMGRYISLLVFTGLPGAAFGMIDRYEADKGLGSNEPMDEFDEIGSNMWAVSPKKSTSGKTMLVINPHLPWDGLFQWWEVHLKSNEGWNTMGCSFFGAPFIGLGHNEYIGWSHTVNGPDIWDVYRVELNPQNLNEYLYNGNWRNIKVEKKLFPFRDGEQIKSVSKDLEYTHYGPIIRRAGDHAYTLKISGWDDVLSVYQWYRMNKARNFHEFKEAMDIMAIPMFNVAYGDREGNIFYAYNGKVARKNEKFDWRKVVEGGTQESEWGEYFSFDELPQVLNPEAGFVQNCNTTPYETTAGDDNPKRENFPGYLAPEWMGARAQRLRQVLESKDKFSEEDFLQMPWDTWSLTASVTIPYLLEIAKKLPVNDSESRILEAIDILSNWDYNVVKDSKAVPVFYRWLTLYFDKAKKPYAEPHPMGLGVQRGIGEPDTAMECLHQAVSDIFVRYGRFPSWGEIHRIRHGKADLPINGGEGERFGTLMTIGGNYSEEDKQFHLNVGHSYVSVVIFTDPVKAWSIFPYGHNRTDPESKHYADQTELFAQSKFKPAWFTEEEIMENTEVKYSLPFSEENLR